MTEDAGKKTFRNEFDHWININHSTVMRICSFVIFAEELGAINELTPKFNFLKNVYKYVF